MDWELKTLLNELKQGREVTNQLMKHLHPPSSHQTRQILLDKILCSYDKALSILNWNGLVVETNPTVAALDVKKDVCKRRKTSYGWTEQVRLCSAKSVHNPLDDGYCWRKYGQKAILGSNFPRGYYRCTHRHSQGCLAIKQVQRSDNDPTNFEIKYRGRHTCNQASHFSATFVPVTAESTARKRSFQVEEEQKQHVQHVGHVVKTEDLDNREEIFPSFSFPVESEQVKNGLFVEALMENDIMGNLSPAFMSPATSESNYFSVSPCHMGSFESDLTDIISDPTSVTNSPIGDLDISSLDKLEFDPSFPFDNPEFFSSILSPIREICIPPSM